MRRVWIEMRSTVSLPVWVVSSPSMRRVWIEITVTRFASKFSMSPSMRRVWIEITLSLSLTQEKVVTLHAEGVD